MILLVVLFCLVISYYFSIKTYEIIEELDLNEQKILLDEMEILGDENPSEYIVRKKKTKHFLFLLLSCILIVVALGLFVCVVFYGEHNTNNIIFGIIIIIVFPFLIFVDDLFAIKELKKLLNDEYRKMIFERNDKLATRRMFFIISSYILIISVLALQFVYDLKDSNANLYNLTNSVLFIYIGGMGLISKMTLLKLPVRPTGKLQPFINIIALGFGFYQFYLAMYKMIF